MSIARVSILAGIGSLLFTITCTPQAPVVADGPLEFEARPREGLHWYKGNTHSHTLNSDGDTAPHDVASWYRTHGYAFAMLTDHNVRTDPDLLHSLVDSSFLLISGVELTVGVEGVPVHVNGLHVSTPVEWQRGANQLATLQLNIDAVLRAGGVAQINHPNLAPGLSIEALEQISGARLIEVHNAITMTNSGGGDGRPSVASIWDRLLTRGMEIYGVASDDAHYFQGVFHPQRPNPGHAWVIVRAPNLTAASIVNSLATGNFYGSTGVEINDVIVEPRRITIDLRVAAGVSYVTRFVGAYGAILAESTEDPAVYDARGDERYVRTEIVDSEGRRAWVQPVFLRPRPLE